MGLASGPPVPECTLAAASRIPLWRSVAHETARAPAEKASSRRSVGGPDCGETNYATARVEGLFVQLPRVGRSFPLPRDRPTLICSLDMISWCSLMLGSSFSPTRAWECFSLRCSTEASVASRSGTAQREAAGNTPPRPSRRPLRSCPHLFAAFLSISCFSCAGKNMRPPPLRKGRSAACASSCNPRTALGQSVAQPEPRTPGAPNSNGCRSGGQDRQLV